MTAALQQTESSSPSSSAEGIQIIVLPPGFLTDGAEYWCHDIARHLAEPLAMAGSKFTLEMVMEQAKTGHAHIWVGLTTNTGNAGEMFGVLVTQFAEFEGGHKVLKLVLGGGDHFFALGTTRTCMDHLEHFARENGCTSVMIEGRRGWGRVLSDYKEVWTTFEKEL